MSYARALQERRELAERLIERRGPRVVNLHDRPKPAYDVRIDRRTKWGNPYRLIEDGGEYTREESIAKYEHEHLPSRPDLIAALPELRGKVLACWCAPEPCHGEVLLRLANGEERR